MSEIIQKNSADRIHSIDVLRGLTLLGIIIAHFTEQYYAGAPPEQYQNQTTSTVIDVIFAGIVGLLITGKFFMIFSFLFGMSFYLQLSKGTGDLPFVLKFAWRLVLLFGIGLVHHLHYRGDILTIYAMLGVVLLLIYRVPDRVILWLGLLLVIDVPGIITRIVELIADVSFTEPIISQDQTILLHYYETFKSGAYMDLLKLNYESFNTKMQYQVWSGRIYITTGLFLLGFYAGRKKIFEEFPSQLPKLKKYLRTAAWTLLGIFLAAGCVLLAANGLVNGLNQNTNIAIVFSFIDLFNACLFFIYVAGFIVIFQNERWHKRLMNFYEAGRMGLTTYLMQSLFGLLIFSTIGLGLLGQIGTSQLFFMAVLLFILQIVIAKGWLKYFNYGPVEWLWRCLTNFRWEPLMKKRVSFQENSIQ